MPHNSVWNPTSVDFLGQMVLIRMKCLLFKKKKLCLTILHHTLTQTNNIYEQSIIAFKLELSDERSHNVKGGWTTHTHTNCYCLFHSTSNSDSDSNSEQLICSIDEVCFFLSSCSSLSKQNDQIPNYFQVNSMSIRRVTYLHLKLIWILRANIKSIEQSLNSARSMQRLLTKLLNVNTRTMIIFMKCVSHIKWYYKLFRNICIDVSNQMASIEICVLNNSQIRH